MVKRVHLIDHTGISANENLEGWILNSRCLIYKLRFRELSFMTCGLRKNDNVRILTWLFLLAYQLKNNRLEWDLWSPFTGKLYLLRRTEGGRDIKGSCWELRDFLSTIWWFVLASYTCQDDNANKHLPLFPQTQLKGKPRLLALFCTLQLFGSKLCQ